MLSGGTTKTYSGRLSSLKLINNPMHWLGGIILIDLSLNRHEARVYLTVSDDITCAAQQHQFDLGIYHHGLCMRFHTPHPTQKTALAHNPHSHK